MESAREFPQNHLLKFSQARRISPTPFVSDTLPSPLITQIGTLESFSVIFIRISYLIPPADTVNAIKASKNSSATGPDGLTAIHLKHLGPKAIAFLTSLFNLLVSKSDIASIWKAALTLPVIKPGKVSGKSISYHPISLLCPAIKILEHLLFPSFSAALVTSPTQHGFKACHTSSPSIAPPRHESGGGVQ